MLIAPFFSKGQQQYFNKRYDFDRFETGWSIVQDSNKYVAAIGTLDTASLVKLKVFAIDSVGNSVWIKSYESSHLSYYAGGPGSLVKTFTGGFAIGGGIEDTVGSINDDATLFVFNNLGDTIWSRSFGDSLFQTFYQCKQTRDSGYICCGYTSSYDVRGDVLLIKTDKFGNLEWQRHYGISGFFENAESVVQTSDGGYFIGGERYNYSTWNGDFMLIKTDSLGNVKWQRFIGGPYEDACWSVLQTSDGNLVGAGAFVVYDSVPHGGNPFSKPFVVKYDTSGVLLWQNIMGPVRYSTGVFTISELPDGDLVAAGVTYDDSAFYSLGLVEKLNGLGDSMWYRTYRNIYGHTSTNELLDIRLCIDGGFIAIGDVNPVVPDTGTQDIWILKLDSMGCDTANCWMYVSVNENNLSEEEFALYPNPAHTTFTITTTAQLQNAQVEIYNVVGEKMYSERVNNRASCIVHCALPPGIYFVKVSGENWRAVQKLVVQ